MFDTSSSKLAKLSLRARATVGIGLVATMLMSACSPAPAASPTAAKPDAKPTTAAAAPASPAAKTDAPSASPAAKPAGSPAAAGSPVAGAAAASPSTIAVSGPFAGEAQALTGAGATFPAPLYSKWFNDYERLSSVKVNYQAIGSGGGIKAITDKTVDFGATDGPMTDDQLQAAGAPILHIPTALGAVVATYNVPELTTPLKLSADTLAGIYLSEIKKWNDPKLVADNPALANVNKDIIVVHRSDGSGTTFIFSDYLSAVSPTWKSSVGMGTSVKWPTGIGAQGNPGVTGEVKQNPYAIGYVEQIYATQNKLGMATIKNSAGQWVEPELTGVTAAAAALSANVPADMRASIVNAPGNASYPISGFTWLLSYREIPDKAKATALTRLMWWATHDGQKQNPELGYAALPTELVVRTEAMINSITTGGQKAFPER
ncbi:MAG: phosphate ABC transporter substrate-binding protein PstS [Chloroflexota bacterium]